MLGRIQGKQPLTHLTVAAVRHLHNLRTLSFSVKPENFACASPPDHFSVSSVGYLRMDIRPVHIWTQKSYPNFLAINWVSDFFHLTFYTLHQPVQFCLSFCDHIISSLAQELTFDPVQMVAQNLQYMLFFFFANTVFTSPSKNQAQ